MNETRSDILKGLLGTMASGGGVALSALSDVEICLRLVSLAVGITVGVLTAVSLWRKLPRKNKDESKD